jgi:micrococcal nuclease
MPFLLSLLVAAAAISHASEIHAPTRSDPVLVREVTSGDTIDVEGIGHVRLLGIDAPTVGGTGGRSPAPAPYGREARDRLAGLVLHRWVRLERDEAPESSTRAQSRTSFARRPAYVMTEEGTFVNAVLVREGLARVSVRASLSRLVELQRAEVEAKTARRGLWSARADQQRTEVSETYRVPKSAKSK